MLRAEQVRVRNGELSAAERLQNQALGRTDLVGTLSSGPAAPLANAHRRPAATRCPAS